MVVMSLAVIVGGVQGNVLGTFLGLVSVAWSAFRFMVHFVEAMQPAKPQTKLNSAPETNTSNG